MKQLSALDPEPRAGSIVLVHGITGTAYQRLYADGMWHAATSHGGDGLTWDQVRSINLNVPVLLVHAAPATTESEPLRTYWVCPVPIKVYAANARAAAEAAYAEFSGEFLDGVTMGWTVSDPEKPSVVTVDA